jgi:NADH-quinone oxidoreductase subunit J
MPADALLTGGAGVAFVVFAVVMLISALAVVLARNPVHSALFLLLCFMMVSAIFFTQGAEFVGAVQILVYAGGIMVLFLFVIMLVNVQGLPLIEPFQRQFVRSFVLIFIFAAIFIAVLILSDLPPAPAFRPEAFRTVGGAIVGNTQAVAWALYRQYLLPFEVASVLLLVAMIGAVVLGKRSAEKMD